MKARSVAFTNLKRGNISHFRFRERKFIRSIVLSKSSLKLKDGDLFIYSNYTKEPIQVSGDKSYKNISSFEYDCRLSCSYGCWYLIVPTKIKRKRVESNKKCALDPGVVTFQTIYEPDRVVKIQQNRDVVDKLHTRLDLFRSLRDKREISRSSFTRRTKKLYKKLKDLVDELHYKTASWLCSSYSSILLPSFESQEMVKGSKRRKMNRNLLVLQHYLFKERMKEKCEEYGCSLEIVDESYTSKTCGRCGELNDSLNGQRIFNCSKCSLVIDRDVNGARNIYLKNCY